MARMIANPAVPGPALRVACALLLFWPACAWGEEGGEQWQYLPAVRDVLKSVQLDRARKIIDAALKTSVSASERDALRQERRLADRAAAALARIGQYIQRTPVVASRVKRGERGKYTQATSTHLVITQGRRGQPGITLSRSWDKVAPDEIAKLSAIAAGGRDAEALLDHAALCVCLVEIGAAASGMRRAIRLRPDAAQTAAVLGPRMGTALARMRRLEYEGELKKIRRSIRGRRIVTARRSLRKLLAAHAKDPALAALAADVAGLAEKVGVALPAELAAAAKPPEGAATSTASGASDVKATAKQVAELKAHAKVIDAALGWLARHQEKDGSWNPAKHGGKQVDAGVTALATLAFLSYGHTHKSGRHKVVVQRALSWLISHQDKDGAIGSEYSLGKGYHQAMCGLALTCAYAMTKDRKLKRPAQKAADYASRVHPSPNGGWRYRPGSTAADLSVTGWFVSQLVVAKQAGLRVPAGVLQGARRFLDKVAYDRDGQRTGYAYQPGRNPGRRMCALGAHTLYLLDKPTAVRLGAPAIVASAPPSWNGVDFYYWYYGTLTMFKVGGKDWETWRGSLIDALGKNQHTQGDEAGSWNFAGSSFGTSGGTPYTTAMGALCLSVPYEYLPLFKK